MTALAHIGPANPAEFQDVISTTERLQPDGRCDRRLGRAASAARRNRSRASRRSPRARPPPGATGSGCAAREATVLKSIDQLPLLGGLLGLALLVGSFAALWYREAR